ncbi:sigma-54-dependent Fis family transcriptional regulator [Pseudoalteromonas phenolica]|uniref:sigma-54-dependent transcriptional regulator n=1 Tax=Pseudoalteromonas phenolica TaxID=161398 RepID=UPI00110C1C32|nr:sigma-54 dependent transcriptional regulator [Pseudoalteromonas phenolica]TMN90367.1 sigma-54-dependent Fis family transcriptional regulator [Pseudoalteromonas phenolica]
MANILVADDDINIIASLQFLLDDHGFDVQGVTSIEAAKTQLTQHNFDLVMLDMNFHRDTTSGNEGTEFIQQMNELLTDKLPPIIAMTGWATIDIAVAALKAGAKDFVQKPWQDEALINTIQTQIKLAEREQQLELAKDENSQLIQDLYLQHDDLIAESAVMQQLLKQAQSLAKSDMNILITGENGTGKSLLASKIHQFSQRASGPFVSANMGAIVESLFESELFGHVKGAFTDAKQNRAGRFQMAQQGTLFLDEIGNIPLAQQAKLLRVLEEKQFEPVGSSKTQCADVRLVSATNTDLESAIQAGSFRQDLFYRLNTVTLHMPALKARKDDIVPLANYFVAKHSKHYGKTDVCLSECAKAALLAYHWPGNLRELSHCIERALFLSDRSITAESLNLSVTGNDAQQNSPTSEPEENIITQPNLTLDEIEFQAMEQRLKHFAGNVTETAKSLGLSRSGYYRRLAKYEAQ